MEKGFKNMNIRFFICDVNALDENTDEIDTREVDEREFLEFEGEFEYERHTVFQNGCSQIYLTKTNIAD